MSGPARDLWIEIVIVVVTAVVGVSSGPARDLWIEIAQSAIPVTPASVGSRKGPVD